ESADVLRFGAGIGQDRHLLVNLRGGLEPERALLIPRHVRVAGIGELGTGRLRISLGRQQQHGQPQRSPYRARADSGECGNSALPRHKSSASKLITTRPDIWRDLSECDITRRPKRTSQSAAEAGSSVISLLLDELRFVNIGDIVMWKFRPCCAKSH